MGRMWLFLIDNGTNKELVASYGYRVETALSRTNLFHYETSKKYAKSLLGTSIKLISFRDVSGSAWYWQREERIKNASELIAEYLATKEGKKIKRELEKWTSLKEKSEA